MANQEVSFEWADGPNANAEGHKLRAFSPNGVEFSPRMQVKASHKNGQWSYNDQIVFVPDGSLIFQMDQSTHGSSSRVDKIWQASEGRPVLFEHRGTWGSSPTWPTTDPLIKKILQQIVSAKIADAWDGNAAVSQI